MFAFNRLAAVLLAFCLSVSVALGDDSRFEVKGEVTGVADSALIVLYEDHGNLMTPRGFRHHCRGAILAYRDYRG